VSHQTDILTAGSPGSLDKDGHSWKSWTTIVIILLKLSDLNRLSYSADRPVQQAIYPI
jgi:hypothetical protein